MKATVAIRDGKDAGTERLAKSAPTLDELLRINEWSVGAVRLRSGPFVSVTVKAAIGRNCRRREGEGGGPMPASETVTRLF